jgi:hypothetical protein
LKFILELRTPRDLVCELNVTISTVFPKQLKPILGSEMKANAEHERRRMGAIGVPSAPTRGTVSGSPPLDRCSNGRQPQQCRRHAAEC